jgi:hypothetical protein
LLYQKLLDLTFPAQLRNSQADVQSRYDNFIAMWDYYVTDLWPLLNEEELALEEHAMLVEERAEAFRTLYVKANKQTCHLYPHIATDHFKDMTLRFRMRLKKIQLQNSEHANKDTKFKQANASNRKKSHNTTETVTPYTRVVNGQKQFVGGYNRSSGPCRTNQIVGQQILGSILRPETTDIEAAEAARLNTARKNAFTSQVCKKLIEELPLYDESVSD